MRRHPWWLGGTGRTVTRLVERCRDWSPRTAPRACSRRRCRTVARSREDRGRRSAPLPAVVVAALRALGVDAPGLADIGRVDVLGGGRPAGALEPVLAG